MSNVQYVVPPYFENLRELARHAEGLSCLSDGLDGSKEIQMSTYLYERDALQNLIGEAQCVIQEATRRIRYLETIAAEDV